MRLSRIYLDSELEPAQRVELPADKAHYIKHVLRLKDRQNVLLFNGLNSVDYFSSIQLEGKKVFAYTESKRQKTNDSKLKIIVLQALGRSEHMDYVVQKATELGASHLKFFNAERTQSPLKNNRLEKKLVHWYNIAISACEQCNRNSIPSLSVSADLNLELLSSATSNRILLDAEGVGFDQLQGHFDSIHGFELLLGSEGGLTQNEIQFAQQQGFLACSLGPRVLRMETATSAIVTLVQQAFGDLN